MGKSFNLELPTVSAPAGFPAVNTIKSILHMVQTLCTFITLCIIASVIATEYRFYDGSQPGPNWTLFVGIFGLVVPVCLVVFPWIYDKKGKFRRLGKFCMKPRTNLIFTGFYTGLWATAGIAMTVHSNNPSNCDLAGDMEEEHGDAYRSAWTSQCSCAKVAAGFAWTTCILWLLSLLCTLVIFFKEKQLIQRNLKQHESNKQAVLQMQQQQQQQESDDDMFGEPVGRHGGYRPAGYYEDEEGEDLGGMRPQSFEQARPLQEATPPPAIHNQQQAAYHQQQPQHEQSPFESPYDPPADPHRMSYGYAQPQYDPHPGGAGVVPEQSPFDDYYRHPSPDPNAAYGAPGPSPSPPQPQGTPAPMAMPDPTQYHNPSANNPHY